jgi:hypothetical protein
MRWRNKNVSAFWGSLPVGRQAKNLSENSWETFILEALHNGLKNLGLWRRESPGFLVGKRELEKSIPR